MQSVINIGGNQVPLEESVPTYEELVDLIKTMTFDGGHIFFAQMRNYIEIWIDECADLTAPIKLAVSEEEFAAVQKRIDHEKAVCSKGFALQRLLQERYEDTYNLRSIPKKVAIRKAEKQWLGEQMTKRTISVTPNPKYEH